MLRIVAAPAPSGVHAGARAGRMLARAGALGGDHRLALPTLFLVGLGPRLWDLGERSLWFDELISLGMAALSFEELRATLAGEANMTLYYWALWAWLNVVGVGVDEALVRLPSAILGATAVPLVYVLGRRLHSSAAGLAAALLLAVNAFDVVLSQQARSYAAFSTLTVLSYLLLDRAVVRGRPRDWALHGVVTALAFYSHFYTAFTVLAQGIFVLSRRSRAAVVGLCGSGLVIALLLAQVVPFLVTTPHASRLAHVLPLDARRVESFFVGVTGGSFATLALYVGLVALGVVRGGGGTGGRTAGYRNWLLLTWFCVPVGLSLAISLAEPIFLGRYLAATAPALPLLAGVGLARLPRPVGAATLAIVAGLSLWALRADTKVRAYETLRPNDHWREAVSYAIRRAEPGDGWIFISKWGQHGFEYYAGWHWGRNPAAPYADVFEPFNWRDARSGAAYRGVVSPEALERFAAGRSRIWLVQSHELDRPSNVDTAAPVRGRLAREGYRARVQQFRGIRVFLYERRGQS